MGGNCPIWKSLSLDYYRDGFHLDTKGAERFTNAIIGELMNKPALRETLKCGNIAMKMYAETEESVIES